MNPRVRQGAWPWRGPSLADGVFIVRLGLILDTLGWAVTLALPGKTFTLSHSYDWMARLLPEDCWAALFLLEGLACVGGLFRGPGLWRSLAPVGAAALYGLVVVSAAQVRPPSTAVIAYFVVMLQAYWLVWMEGRMRKATLSGPQAG